MPDARNVNSEALAKALRAKAAGVHTEEAAASLLIHHATWLRRTDFLRHVTVTTSVNNPRVTYASINWNDIDRADLPASSSELRLLHIAMELAGHTTGQPISELLYGLDHTNTLLVLRAVLHAARGAGVGPLNVTPLD
jgi:hypothetical protein